MPFINFNHLQTRLARACILTALPLAIGLGSTMGAYLPSSGPVPLRFQPVIAHRVKANPVSPPIGNADNHDEHSPEGARDLAKHDPDPYLDYDAFPLGFDIDGQFSGSANAPHKVDISQMDPITAMREDPAAFPQFLVPFFTGQFGASTNVPASNGRVVEFAVPAPVSSSATYQSH